MFIDTVKVSSNKRLFVKKEKSAKLSLSYKETTTKFARTNRILITKTSFGV